MPDSHTPILVPFARPLWDGICRQPTAPITLQGIERGGVLELVASEVFTRLQAGMLVEAVEAAAAEHDHTDPWVALVDLVRAIAGEPPRSIATHPSTAVDVDEDQAPFVDRWLAAGGGRGPVGGP